IGGFTPDAFFETLVKNYSAAKKIYGERLLRLLTGYSGENIERNLKIPEFQREIKKNIAEKIEELKNRNLLDKDGQISEQGKNVAGLVMAFQELDNIIPKGLVGQKMAKQKSHYGEKMDARNFRKGDRYKDIAVKNSVRAAIRRGHSELLPEDLKTFTRQSKGTIYLIYAIDASASMKGEKIEMAKRAGVALSFKAISEKDMVGLVVFNEEVQDVIPPTNDFGYLLHNITRIKASSQTNFTKVIEKSVEVFPSKHATKHLVIITDALPNVGDDPEKDTLKAISLARSNGITVSLLGINLDGKGSELAKNIARLGDGRFYTVKNLKEMDKIVLEDYYSVVG
ncbi:MAG: VWA domain-containing protein, partial [Nanoarchaeota archaeon]